MEQRMYGQGGVDPLTGLEGQGREPMWQLGLGGGGGVPGVAGVYPERPGESDCMYYIRTGSCGYGERCRFNHPRNRTLAVGASRAAGEYPERLGQPPCQYFLKTGSCKFGTSCKYHHPKQGASSRHVSLNSQGYPLRPGEKECTYYVKTGQCKFGVTCKFHHPQAAGVSALPPPPSFYPAMQSPSVPSPQMYAAIPSWQVARPQLLPGSYVQGAYGPLLLSPVIPVSGWNPYPPPVSPVVSSGDHHNVQASSLYSGLQQQLSASAPAYVSPYQPVSSSAGPSSSTRKEHSFPERPGQAECQFYMRTGDCKFGPTCRYHHPPDWSIPKTNCTLSPIGLPLRPGAPPCTFYAQHGVCKFGPTCKFDHPMGMLSYSPSASSLADMPGATYPLGFSVPTLVPSSSSSQLRPEYYASASSRDSFSARISISGNTSSGSIGSVFSTRRSAPHFLAQVSGQSTIHTSSSIGHGGEITGSS